MNRSSIFLATIAATTFSLRAQDNFADAVAVDFLQANGGLVVSGSNANATAEDGEPAHAGVPASGSIWLALTVDEARRVELAASPDTAAPPAISNIVMAVYTGNSLESLTPVSRYPRLFRPASSKQSNPGSEPFTQNARVVFDAEPDTTYFVAIDGENGTQGSFQVNVSTSPDILTPEFELIPAGAEWSYYQALSGTTAADPTVGATADADFYSTWHTAAAYDGPEFLGPQPTPMSYGSINTEPNAAFTLVAPTSGQRTAVTYFRTTVIPDRRVTELGFEGVVDDGAIIYVNGIEVDRINVLETITNPVFNTPAINATATEDTIRYVVASNLDLPAGQEIEIAVSLHNATGTSSDSGFHMRVFATKADPEPVTLSLENSNFEDTYILVWEGRQGFSYEVQFADTDFTESGWQTKNTETPDEDGTIRSFVLNRGDRGFWRVITSPVADE